MTDTPEISDEERARIAKWARETTCDYIEVRPSTISGYESRLSRTERERDALEDLLNRAINGPWTSDDLIRAREALAGKGDG